VIVRVLGSAAGGGVPQWNCACVNCTAVRRGERPARTQSSFAFSSDGARWTLVNCSPDVTRQIEAAPQLQPTTLRGTPLDGMLLTDANVDHIGGLAELRQAGEHRFTLRSSATVREIATRQTAFAKFAEPPHRWLVPDADGRFALAPDGDALAAFDVRAIDAPGTTPGYDGRRVVPGAVSAFAVRERASGATVLFAPVYAALDAPLLDEISRADVAFLDGSFFSDDEMEGLGAGAKRARDLGHLPLDGPAGTLARLAALANRRILVHLNNTNPVLDPASEAARAVAAAGLELARDGLEVRL
jgi:pyrroloquinoline quinone biosynthesis protein B